MTITFWFRSEVEGGFAAFKTIDNAFEEVSGHSERSEETSTLAYELTEGKFYQNNYL